MVKKAITSNFNQKIKRKINQVSLKANARKNAQISDPKH